MDALRQRMEKKPAEVRRALRQCGIPDETLHIYGDRYKSMKPPAGMPADLAMLYPCKEIYVKRVGVPLAGELPAGDHRPGFGGPFCASGLSICCFGRPRMRAWQSWMHSG